MESQTFLMIFINIVYQTSFLIIHNIIMEAFNTVSFVTDPDFQLNPDEPKIWTPVSIGQLATLAHKIAMTYFHENEELTLGILPLLLSIDNIYKISNGVLLKIKLSNLESGTELHLQDTMPGKLILEFAFELQTKANFQQNLKNLIIEIQKRLIEIYNYIK